MRSSALISFLSFLVSAGAQTGAAPSLFEALAQNGASKFAQTIQADPVLLAKYTSPDVGTVFAPADSLALPPTSSGSRRRDTTDQQQLSLAAGHGVNVFSTLDKPPGVIIETTNTDANLGGQGQNIVTDARNSTITGQKRWLISGRQTYGHGNGTEQKSLLAITSGLGQVVNVIKADIPYSGGVIHLVDNYFTIPETVSNTANAAGLSTFGKLASSANLTGSLDNTPITTVFLPSNAAFAAANISTSTGAAAAARLLGGHILPNFLGYLPNLHDGDTLTTQGGKTLTVKVKGKDYYINNAKISQANIILPNGVAHVVDSVIEPNQVPVIAGTNSIKSAAGGVVMIMCTGLAMAFMLGTA
ncbi:FAS1 domain-containing protein [Diplogelasinospora grovesii]|uniref:FAS1 domain-containing protein n=1 Tax=Diplogelasinospora grovesii TaxID=303347 RepID=A0AAN6MZR6_9PEZI|nr:FAS1 domain-containing protein [Diplogelasinospora grovesii]